MLLLIPLLLLFAVRLQARPWSEASSNTTSVAKRWYHLSGPGSDPTHGASVWPPPYPEHDQRWIAQRWVRYCFYEERDYDNLHDILFRGIAMWAPALELSSVRVRPDTTCGNDLRCICKDKNGKFVGSKDALVVVDSTLRPKTDPFAKTSCHVGYMAQRRLEASKDSSYQYLHSHIPHDDVKGYDDLAIFEMAHELGHSFGLVHEHERPDIMDWVECNLVPTGDKDHEDLWKWLEWKQDKRLHASMNGKARLLTICNDPGMIRDYFPGTLCANPVGSTMKFSDVPDFDSIMISNSKWMIAEFDVPIVFKKHPYKQPGNNPQFIFPGGVGDARTGTVDWSKGSISVGDLQAIAKMYPAEEESKRVEAQQMMRWEPMEVELPGITVPRGTGNGRDVSKVIVRQNGDNRPVRPERRVKLFEF